MTDPYPVSAWRVGRRRADGAPLKRLVVRTSSYPTMVRWLARSRLMRRGDRHTLWLEEDRRPASALREVH